MTSVVICYSSDRNLIHESMPPKPSSCILPVTGAPTSLSQLSSLPNPSSWDPSCPRDCFPLCQLCPSGPPQNKPFQCLKVVFMGVIPPPQFIPSLCLRSPECFSDYLTKFLSILFPIPTFLLSSGVTQAQTKILRSRDSAFLPREELG